MQHWYYRTKRRTPKNLLAVKVSNAHFVYNKSHRTAMGENPSLRRTESVNKAFVYPLVCQFVYVLFRIVTIPAFTQPVSATVTIPAFTQPVSATVR
jgi:hypothetical protein